MDNSQDSQCNNMDKLQCSSSSSNNNNNMGNSHSMETLPHFNNLLVKRLNRLEVFDLAKAVPQQSWVSEAAFGTAILGPCRICSLFPFVRHPFEWSQVSLSKHCSSENAE